MSFLKLPRPHKSRIYWYQDGRVKEQKCMCQECMNYDYKELQVGLILLKRLRGIK